MKIAMIGHKRIPGREGGIEVVVEELATRLANKGHIVVAYNRKKAGSTLPAIYKGVNLVTIPTVAKKNTDAVVYSFLASVKALFGKYDVIHYHGIGPAFFLIIPHLLGIKTVVTVHGLNYKTPKWSGLGAVFLKYGEKIAAKYAEKVIVLSLGQQQYFKKAYNRDTVFIPNGTSVKKVVDPEIIKRVYGLEKQKYLLFVSRIVPGKGLEYLLEAYKKVECEFPLIIAGGTAFVDDFYHKISKTANQDSRVKIIGFVEGKLLQELYSNAALFVFPSEAEGMPMCLLEALSYNCRCLVSDIPENMQVGQDYVQSFRSCDTEDLRAKIEACITNPDTLFPNLSRGYIKDKYDWNQVTDDTERCYRE